MTAEARKLAQEMLDGLESVTPGPWAVGDNEILVDGRYQLCDFDGSVLSPDEDEANLAHLARCSPENIALLCRALLDREGA